MPSDPASARDEARAFAERAIGVYRANHRRKSGHELVVQTIAADFTRALTAARREDPLVIEAAQMLLDALDTCESNRGKFSCVEAHDLRCPKSRAPSAEQWRGEWICECGSEALDAAVATLQKRIRDAAALRAVGG